MLLKGTVVREFFSTETVGVFTIGTIGVPHLSKLKGECTDVKSGCGPLLGPSLYPHSLS